jgi:hypothetical protein
MNHGWGLGRPRCFIALIKAASGFDMLQQQPAGSAWLLFLSLGPFTRSELGLAAGCRIKGCDVH